MGDIEQGDPTEVELLAPSSRDFHVSREELLTLNEARRRIEELPMRFSSFIIFARGTLRRSKKLRTLVTCYSWRREEK